MNQNLEIARAALAAYSGGDVETTLRAFAPDAMIHGPVSEGNFETVEWSRRGGLPAYIEQIARNWRLESYEVANLHAEGDWVTSFIRIAAANWKTGKRAETVFVGVMRFRDGLVVDYHEILDVAPLRAAAAK
jgi:ketosteroid isomerase-like protein